MAKSKTREETRPAPPKGSVDAADDLMLDMERAGPDPDEVVVWFEGDKMVEMPAREYYKKYPDQAE